MAYVQLNSRGFLPPGTDVETLIRETGYEQMLLAVLDTYHHRRTPLEQLKGTPDRPKVWQRMLDDTAPVTALQALAASKRLAELIIGRRWYLMLDAREDGNSWSAIGAALDITKQGAQDWYRRQIENQERYVSDLHNSARARQALHDEGTDNEKEK